MAITGWYFVEASNFDGPDNSVMCRIGNAQISGDANFTFVPATKILSLTGTMNLDGTLNIDGLNSGVMANNQVSISRDTIIAANSRAILYTDSNNSITVENGKTLTIGDDSVVLLQVFPDC
tara:strand:+ start:712 stop:1074 length:363 start_codon:yes stop_codon:yes gene_type:complete